ncbi:MAG: FecR domain-containing protein [Fibrobacter sp.]|nr:FecR domain-containing protein [Fibrobacter sp.]
MIFDFSRSVVFCSRNRVFSIVLTVALLFVSGAFAGPPSAKVGFVLGGVFKEDKSVKDGQKNSWQALRVGNKLYEKDVVKTEVESNVGLRLLDGSKVSIPEASLVEIVHLYGGEGGKVTEIKVIKGFVSFDVEKQKSDAEFKFTTGTMVAAIRGTKGVVNAYPFFAGLENGKLDVGTGPADVRSISGGETVFYRKGDNGKSSFLKMSLKNSGKADFVKYIRGIALDEKLTMKEFMKRMVEADRQFDKEELKIKKPGEEKGVYKTIKSPADELEKEGRRFYDKGILYGIGIAAASDEITARSQSLSEARNQIGQSVMSRLTRYKEHYAKNMEGEAAKIWEEKVNAYTNKNLSGASEVRVVNFFDDVTKKYKAYSLMVLNPRIVKNALQEAFAEVGFAAENLETDFAPAMDEFQKAIAR